MSALALTLVLTAALFHATWNLLVKRAGGGAIFVWLFSALATVVYAPAVAVVLLIQRPHVDATMLVFLVGSPVLNLAYFLLLQRGYRHGDLSLVYPLARGTGPLLSSIGGITLFGERPGILALAGILLITLGVAVLVNGSGTQHGVVQRRTVAYGLLIGISIAAYTLWDKNAVSAVAIPPIALDWTIFLGQAMFLAPYALAHKAKVAAEWRTHKREALGVALLSPVAYVLVLTALVFTPVSYVAPARELSILIGVLMGSRLLAEGQGTRRLVAASAMVIGVTTLALA